MAKSSVPRRKAKPSQRSSGRRIGKFAVLLNQMGKEDDGTSIIRKLRRAPAVLTEDEMYAGERRAQDDGMPRRICLGVLKNSGGHLLDVVKDKEGALTMAEMDRIISEYVESLAVLTALAREAQARVGIALATRTGMEELMAQVKKEARSSSEAAA